MARAVTVSRITRVVRFRHIDVYVHWSVFLIGTLVLIGGIRKPIATLIGLAAYVGVLAIHETGHLMVARRKGYDAMSMELYPIFGLARIERPDSRVDRAIIAWGGVAAQAVVGIPLTLYTVLWGYTRFEAINAALAILGGASLLIAAINLLPISRLDGSQAWDLIPALIERRQRRRMRRVMPYRSPR